MIVKWQSDTPKMELKVPSEVKVGGYIPTAEDLTFTGEQTAKLFEYGKFFWVLKYYTSLLSFFNIKNADSCFASIESDVDVDLTNLTFYMSNDNSSNNIQYMFAFSNLSSFPHIVGVIRQCQDIFYSCYNLRSIPDNFFDDFIFQKSSRDYIDCGSIFQGCYNLTKVPSLKAFKQLDSTKIPAQYYNFYNYLFSDCHNLQEIRDLPIVYGINSAVKENFFTGIVNYTYKLSSFTFEPNQIARLSNQQLNFQMAGWEYGYPQSARIKNSVYNHDSAVETINSLPDTSAFLAEVGGTNTIRFYRNQGANTEGGAIGNLTAEEIAIAVAKGWTVALYDG